MKQFLNITQRKFIEWLIILSIFMVSIPNKWTLMISIALSLLLLKRGALGVVQLIILYMLRSQIYTPYDTQEMAHYIVSMKYILTYVIGVFFLFKYVKHWIRNEMILRFIKSTMILMLLYIIMSLVVSNDPIESILKLLNFFIPLILIVMYVSLIKKIKNLINWINQFITLMIVFTFLLIVIAPKSYLIDGESLRSVFKDEHSFAIILAMGLVLYMVTKIKQQDYDVFNLLLLNIGMIELYLSNSRHIFISVILCLMLLLPLSHMKKRIKHPIIGAMILMTIAIINQPYIYHLFIKLILKGKNSQEVFMPSDMNIKAIDYALTEHPFLGSGFGIPMIKASSEIQYFNVETSNIIFGMIIFTGIIGLTLCTIYMLHMVLLVTFPMSITILLFLITIFVNMDHIILFDSVGLGILCYIFWGIYLKEGMYQYNNGQW